MSMVEVVYSGESALKKPDGKGKMSYSHNRCLTVKGKPYRMTEGVHKMPMADYEAFAATPVGKELVSRGALKLRTAAAAEKKAAPAKEEKKEEAKPEKKAKKKKAKKASAE